MNGGLTGSKPLHVALAQRKEDRKAQLASQYMTCLASMRMAVNLPLPRFEMFQGNYKIRIRFSKVDYWLV